MFYIMTCASAVLGGGINFAQKIMILAWVSLRLTFASCVQIVTMDKSNNLGTL